MSDLAVLVDMPMRVQIRELTNDDGTKSDCCPPNLAVAVAITRLGEVSICAFICARHRDRFVAASKEA